MAIAVEFLPVGDSDGDAIIVQYGTEQNYYLTVVDGGYASVGEQVIEHIEEHYGRDVTIHNMVVSHAMTMPPASFPFSSGSASARSG
jgi:hypothetical protein